LLFRRGGHAAALAYAWIDTRSRAGSAVAAQSSVRIPCRFRRSLLTRERRNLAGAAYE